jgi:hypothetical protein
VDQKVKLCSTATVTDWSDFEKAAVWTVKYASDVYDPYGQPDGTQSVRNPYLSPRHDSDIISVVDCHNR